MKTLHAFITAVLVLSASSSNLYAYETEWEDPKFTETKEKPEPSEQTDETRSDQPPEEKKNLPEDKALNSTFKVTGNIWSSYEFLDRSVNGVPDKAGSDKAGFKVGRARVNFRGKVNKGFAKGYAYRITVDTARAAALGDGCESPTGCKEHNDYLFYIKDAYTNIPLPISFGKNNLRIGQQHTPIVENQTQYNQVRSWGHRYLDSAGKAVWDETGLGASRDVGISLIHKNTYYSVHVMLANGEGYHKPNAEGLDISGNNVKLEDMAVGKSGASYGYDVYGMLVATPTGKNKDFIVNIGLPFRYHNIVGIDQSEYSRTTADFTDLNAPKYNYYRGDKRALQDITYGLEGEVVINRNDFSVTAGAGAAVKLDKAGYAFKFDDTVWFGVYPGDFQAISDHYAVEEDRYGYMNYVFLHTKFRKFGAFARL
ncbi:MAG: OprO/OprP family phosphate-selective porin, partial [Spirochaetia bacterium]|nr:OprO/OprP family phosphate-selective porin [Spirochaetia bacterium]